MKQFTGTVVSNKMTKTIVVSVKSRQKHPVYQKTITTTKKYLVHDEKGEGKLGATVRIAEVRPQSKNKRFTLVKILENL